jgi:hypothetical protein
MILPLNSDVADKQKPTNIQLKPSFLSSMGLPLFLLVIMMIGILPGYLQGGKWRWWEEKVPGNLAQILNVEKKGLSLPNWEIVAQNRVEIGGKKWLVQVMKKGEQIIQLLILPQPYYKDKPSVEWTDLEKVNVDVLFCSQKIAKIAQSSPKEIGIQSSYRKIAELLASQNVTEDILKKMIAKLPQSCQTKFRIQTTSKGDKVLISLEDYRDWQTQSQGKLTFRTDSGQSITALLNRGWSPTQNFAIINWYAWESGGSFSPEIWFWQDLKAKLNNERTGWLAVSLRIPISAKTEVESIKTEAKIIAQEIQTQLTKQISKQTLSQLHE